MTDLRLPDELADLAAALTDFTRTRIAGAEQHVPGDARDMPHALRATLQQHAKTAGYWCLEAPEEFGGGGLSVFAGVVATEAMARHRYSLPIPGAGVFGLEPPVVLYTEGTPDQIDRYVRPCIEHAWDTFIALSEPTGGSDPARAIRTTATRHGDVYRLTGTKMWISSADKARYGLVYARTAPGRDGISAFLLDMPNHPAVSVSSIPVIRDEWTNQLRLDDVEIPVENLVGREGDGFQLAQHGLARIRLRYAAAAIGVAEEAIHLACQWVSTRSTFGALLATRQHVQFTLADARMRLNAARYLTWDAALALDAGENAQPQVSMAKVYATEAGFEIVDAVMQLFGGMGMAKEMPLEHWFRGLRVARIVEGPSEVHRFLISRDMLGAAALGRPA